MGRLLDIYRRQALVVKASRREQGPGLICNWIRDEDADPAVTPMVDMVRYRDLLSILPDKIVDSLERARLERAGLAPMFKAGLGYEALLSSIIVDATAVTATNTETKLAPALLIPANFMQPGGIPGKTLRHTARGRATTTTAATTFTVRQRIAATDIITGNTLAASGAVTADAAAQTATQWEYRSETVVRSVGSAGTTFTQGKFDPAFAALTIAAAQAKFAGSAGGATPSTAVWDMTVAQFLQFTLVIVAASQSVQAHQYMLEDLN